MYVIAAVLIAVLAGERVSASGPIDKTILRPVVSSVGERDSFRLHYRLYPVNGRPWNDRAPTVLFLQGGPGLAILHRGRPSFVPEQYQLLILDPRGTGLSRLPANMATDQEASSSAILADDVSAIIEAERLAHFILWGHSYGTVIATIVTSKLELSGRGPKSLILEGAIGRSFRVNSNGEHEVMVGFRETLDGAFGYLAAPDQERLQRRLSELRELPDGADLVRTMVHSEAPKGLFPLHFSLVHLARSPSKFTALNQLKVWSASIDREDPDFDQQMLNIACSEIVADWEREQPMTLSALGGTLDVKDSYGENCKQSIKRRKLFDAEDFPVRSTPILYFAGTHDPKTPAWQSQYHQAAMKRSNSATRLSVVSNQGHMPLQYSSPICRHQALIAAMIGNVEANLSACL